jgi:hypothetical protein
LNYRGGEKNLMGDSIMPVIDFRTIPADIKKLKNNIEKISGTELQVIVGDMDIGANETLMNRISNGIPILTVKKGTIPSNDSISHELFELHLKLTNGEHSLRLEGNLLNHIKKNCQRPQVVVSKAHSILLHAHFYPKMIALGYHPTEYIEKQFVECGEKYPISAYQNTDISLHVAMDLWHLSLGFSDDQSRAKELYSKVEKNYACEKKKAIELFATSQNFTAPELQSALFSNILRTLFDYSIDVLIRKEGKIVIYS